VVTETDALYLTPKQPHQLALFTQVDEVIQARLNTMASGLRYDAFYMTRKQKERMKDGCADNSYPTIGPDFLNEKRFQNTVVMHPLPRVDELSPEVDKDRRGIYFKQAAYGVPVRMALLKFLFDQRSVTRSSRSKETGVYHDSLSSGSKCRNLNCVTLRESVSTQRRMGLYFADESGVLISRCGYCDHRFKVELIGHVNSRRYCAYDIAFADTVRAWMRNGELAIFDSIKEAEELGYEPYKTGPQRVLMEEAEISAALTDIGQQILRDCQETDRLTIVGVRSVGSRLAQRIAREIEARLTRKLELGEIEIYGSGNEIRRILSADPDAGPLNLKDREVILVDDVIFTGRTVKSALSILFRSGRPKSVRLAVLIDRGHREIPVKPNYVAKNIPSSENERVRVRLHELEQSEQDQAVIYSIVNPIDEVETLSRNEEKTAAELNR
jgi:pyrimidine operon attenuation protein / uracil phosphoribosyltransferase